MAQRNDQDPYKNGKDRPDGKNLDPTKVNPPYPKTGNGRQG